MTINKQALRINARLASAGEWIKESGDGWEAICSSDDQANAGFIVAHFEGPDAKENREYVQVANPATVLMLLDELEAAENRIAEHKFENRLLANADRDIKALRQRIAELEARKVNLPLAYDINIAGERIHHKLGDHFDSDEVVGAICAAGIGIKGERDEDGR